MKKVNRKHELHVRGIGRRLRDVGQTLVFYHNVAIERVVFVGGLLAVVGVIMYLALVEPTLPAATDTQMIGLDRDVLDTLELWIEERQAEASRDISVPSGVW